ncbi:MAG TPA: sensor histidine kinase [Nocardioidaceae bacterium]|nr:sensor histidine kinase [Nocardioidaceae bacterium]
MAGRRGGRSSAVAQQIFVLQTLIVLLVVVAAAVLAVADARRTQLDGARDRSVAVAEAVADAPTLRQALRGGAPSEVIQPYAEQVRRDSGTDFVVVMALDRTRYSHPDPARIGHRFIGDLGGAPQGSVFTQEYTGTLGPSMRAVVPVFDGQDVVALVSVGITLDRIDEQLRSRLVSIGVAGLLVLGLGAAGAWLISRRLRRQTHGLGEREITRMYEYYDAVLHAVREGLLLVDAEGTVQLVNDEATRLLGIDTDPVGRPVTELGLPEPLTESIRAGASRPDEIHLVGDLVLVLNQSPARWQGHELGSVVTLRDHTELQAVAGELDTVRGLAESLRSQNHEAANRLHTVVSLIELDRTEEALDFATEELQVAQLLTDRVVGAVDEPVVAALLLGKSAQAAERGVELRIGTATRVSGLFVEPRDMITLLGNLLDNAFDAVSDSPTRRVEVEVVADEHELTVRVADSGRGLAPDMVARVFERGWSTKTGSGPAAGRGLGLALVGQVVRRYGGAIDVGTSDLGGACFDVHLSRPEGDR